MPRSSRSNVAQLAIDTRKKSHTGHTTDPKAAICTILGVILGLLIGGLVDRGLAVIGCFIGFFVGMVIAEVINERRQARAR
jgi:hypothetical protein